MRRCMTGAFLTTGLLAMHGSGTCAHAANIPDTSTGDLSFCVRRTDVASGYVWGHGTLRYGGECASTGFAHIAGTAYLTGQGRLHDAEDPYRALQTDTAAGGGRDRAVMENIHGVNIALTAHSHGVYPGASVMRFFMRIRR
ncbi:hypothetical protein GLUCOINTEAF2_0202818 [Komagataeibacter intermedius AF2]|uniref:Uncharacterized protein n=2 Tax=Komagataeibacter intermedius TaxID=66229 RepID=A0A0N0MF31_9PROT|nr:hypothetical protein GLUCOINTEAF2_0202818 [Komagataeibacter intermedius AF2]